MQSYFQFLHYILEVAMGTVQLCLQKYGHVDPQKVFEILGLSQRDAYLATLPKGLSKDVWFKI